MLRYLTDFMGFIVSMHTINKFYEFIIDFLNNNNNKAIPVYALFLVGYPKIGITGPCQN